MPLAFDERQLLPTGVHDASLLEVEQHFARFQKSERRIRLFEQLRRYIAEVQKTGWDCQIIIDGSFVMLNVDEPEDIDLILVMPKDWDLTAELKPHQYNLVSKGRARKEYRIEVYPVRAGSAEEARWVALFCQVNVKWRQQFGWPADSKKGIVRIVE